jgi:hypothetical protein
MLAQPWWIYRRDYNIFDGYGFDQSALILAALELFGDLPVYRRDGAIQLWEMLAAEHLDPIMRNADLLPHEKERMTDQIMPTVKRLYVRIVWQQALMEYNHR